MPSIFDWLDSMAGGSATQAPDCINDGGSQPGTQKVSAPQASTDYTAPNPQSTWQPPPQTQFEHRFEEPAHRDRDAETEESRRPASPNPPHNWTAINRSYNIYCDVSSEEDEYDSDDTVIRHPPQTVSSRIKHGLASDDDDRRRPSGWRPPSPFPFLQTRLPRQLFAQPPELVEAMEEDESSVPLGYEPRRPSQLFSRRSVELIEGFEDGESDFSLDYEPQSSDEEWEEYEVQEDVEFEFIGDPIVIDNIADVFSLQEHRPETCTLCLEDHDPANGHTHVVLKACGHIFCSECLDGMLNSRYSCINTCPNCRFLLVKQRMKRPILAP
ncbi:uncharacterized protein BDZ99DRAFT_221530 [Mytilinidion resinicola]|uniref:RING-type domain-containing protein n=1 Tax=Mytilinidion resinicola TaxID=574789 RepID=A0A6A6XY34_9PEZI|nr:uncharacterized protein BDZ99DRAFT_221530 [Mytilinidion resinicola]KAF2801461.1 hypothetical protein BDZ99DRAFT_221530 [Mytilinidion resinicola]